MVRLDDLNPEQRAAVCRTHGPMMILAGAGTGKTRVITYRIAHMVGAGIQPGEIVALSFTNKAAREMTERVKALVGEGRAKKLWLGTFHSFCLSILRTYPEDAGLAKQFGLIGTGDQIDLVRKALEEKHWAGEYDADRMHNQISTLKNYLVSPEDLLKGEKLPEGVRVEDTAVLAAVYELYERQLKLNRVIDFDDCIYRCVRLLTGSPHVRAALRAKYRYLMVDEYQDTNMAQLKVLELMASDGHDVCVVGDDDQSIYSWRGAMYTVLERFQEMFPGAQIIKLEQNYRCSNVILGAANAVIRNNTQRMEKTLWSASKETAPIELVPQEDETKEANFIAQKILSFFGQGHQPKDIGILYRANALARPLELALREARINYKTYGGQSFFERKEVKDFLAYFRLVIDPEDRLALWRVINTPQRGIGMKSLERIETLANVKHLTPFAVVKHESLGGGKSEASAREFARMIEELGRMPLSSPEAIEALGREIIKASHLEQDIRERSEEGGSRDRKVANLRSLPGWLATVAKDLLEEDGEIDRQALLDVMTLDGNQREKEEQGKNHVSLMTIHAAKGLEFPIVFVVGLEEDLIPHKNSAQDPKAVCEERRLFYVALTRAKSRLILSYCLERTSGQNRSSRRKTRFLDEMPADTYEETDTAQLQARAKASEDTRRTASLSRIGSLRANLKAP